MNQWAMPIPAIFLDLLLKMPRIHCAPVHMLIYAPVISGGNCVLLIFFFVNTVLPRFLFPQL